MRAQNKLDTYPTRGVRVEVVIEDDWTSMVIPAPMAIATYPFTSVAL
jgi:hypothetical protein